MTLENINKQAKDLVYNLLNNGDSYIMHCNDSSISYKINEKIVNIAVRRTDEENFEYKVHIPSDLSFEYWTVVNPKLDKAEHPICFEVSINNRWYYYHPEDRVKEATLLDLFEKKASKFLYGQMAAINRILSYGGEEDNLNEEY